MEKYRTLDDNVLKAKKCLKSAYHTIKYTPLKAGEQLKNLTVSDLGKFLCWLIKHIYKHETKPERKQTKHIT